MKLRLRSGPSRSGTAAAASTINWSDSANWSGVAILPGDQLVFDGTARLTTNNDQPPGTAYNGMIFNPTAGAFTHNGNAIVLSGDILNQSPNTQTLNLPMAMDGAGTRQIMAMNGPVVTGGSGTINNNGYPLAITGSANVTLGGSVSGSGALTMNGAGTLALNASNTFSGNTRVSSGILSVGHSLALQNSTLDMNAADSGSVTFNNLSTVTLGGLNGARNLGLGAAAVTVGGNNASTTYSGVLSGGAPSGSGLTKTGNGLLSLGGMNTYSGATLISGGTLQLTGAMSSGAQVVGVTSVAAPSGAAAIYNFDSLAPGTTTIPNLGSLGATASGSLSGASIVAGGGLGGGNVLTIRAGQADAMLIPNPIDMSSSNWTLSAWFENPYTSGGGAGWDALFQQAAGNGNWIVINNETAGNGTVGLGTVSNRDGGFWHPAAGPGFSMANSSVASGWHQLTAVGNNSGANGTTSFYIDGSYVGSIAVAANTNLGRVGNAVGGGNQPFAQYLDNVYVYQQSLSASQVVQLYQSGLGAANTLPSTSPVNIANGVLDVESSQVIGPLSGSTSASVNLGGNFVLVVNDISNTTFAGVIGGSGSLVKGGTGALTLSGSNTFLGATTVSAGTLALVAGSALTGPLTIGSGAVAGGNGAFNGGITVAGGGLLSVGGPGSTTNATSGPFLTLQSGSTVNIKADAKLNCNEVVLTGSNTLTLGNNLSVNLLAADGVTPFPAAAGTTYDLIQFSGTAAGTSPAAAFKVANRVALMNYTFGYDGSNQVAVTINAAPLWTGSGANNNWSAGGNWTITPTAGQTVAFSGTTAQMTVNNDLASATYGGVSFGPAPGAYTLTGSNLMTMTGDIMNFSPSTQTIDLPLGMAPNSVGIALNAQTGPIVTTVNGTINNNGNPLTLSGSSTVTLNGVISGSGAVTKIGTGTAVLAASNAYTGNTNVNGGVLQVSNDYNLGAPSSGSGGSIVFNGGTLQAGGAGLSSSRTVTLNAGNGTFDSNNLNSTLFGQITGAGGLTMVGNGLLTVSNTGNSYTGGTTVSGGTLQAGVTTALGTGTVTLNGGTLRLNTPLSPAAAGLPLAVTGFTGDDIAEASASTPSAGTNVEYNGWWWYEKGAPNSTQGLPNWAATGGTLSSVYAQSNGSHTLFQLQPYGSTIAGTTTHPNNVADVPNGGSLTMTLTNPAKCSNVELLFSGQGVGNYAYNVTLNFSDSSTYTYQRQPLFGLDGRRNRRQPLRLSERRPRELRRLLEQFLHEPVEPFRKRFRGPRGRPVEDPQLSHVQRHQRRRRPDDLRAERQSDGGRQPQQQRGGDRQLHHRHPQFPGGANGQPDHRQQHAVRHGRQRRQPDAWNGHAHRYFVHLRRAGHHDAQAGRGRDRRLGNRQERPRHPGPRQHRKQLQRRHDAQRRGRAGQQHRQPGRRRRQRDPQRRHARGHRRLQRCPSVQSGCLCRCDPG